MSQIVEKKKKGRPSKADLARRAAAELPASVEMGSDVRRSFRRRSVRYMFDLDDFVEELDDEEENKRRREKKLKQLLKLQSNESGSESVPTRTRRVTDVPAVSASSSGGEDGDRPLKKRKMDGDVEIDGDDEDDEVRRRKTASNVADSAPGTPSDPPLGLPLPEKKSLELILDKLQKKDTYGVYAEPVDPDELPDYHDVIEHPMDFGTVRKKLGNGLYSTLEQFESDVYLICSNAMEYNRPDTVYYKQAHSIQELAKKKFQGLRIDVEHYEKELESGQKPRSYFLAKQQVKKPMSTTPQEPVGPNLSSAATVATAGDLQNGSNGTRDGGFERLTNVDGPVVGKTSPVDNNVDKAEDLQGRVPLSRVGRKAFAHDENRRATYGISNQPMVGSESIFTTFDGEVKQLVAVGIHADHSYARSLALFAATLGPVAWKVASRQIEEALPLGFKYGRGWVGDYEPVPTPVLMLENCSPKEPVFLPKTNGNSNPRKDDKTSNSPLSVPKRPISSCNLQGKPSLVSAAATKPIVSPAECADNPLSMQKHAISSRNLQGKPSLVSAAATKPVVSPAECADNPLSILKHPISSRNLQGKPSLVSAAATKPIVSPAECADNPLSILKHTISSHNLQGKPSLVSAAATKPIVSPAECAVVSAKEPSEGKQPVFSSGRTTPTTTANGNYQHQSPCSRSNDSGKKVVKQLELNCTPISANQNTCSLDAEKQISNGLDVPASQSMENFSRNRNLLQSVPLKQPANHGFFAGGLPNGELISNSLYGNRKVVSSSDSVPKQMVTSATYNLHGLEQGLGDPVQCMRLLAENAEKQQKSVYHSSVYNPSVMPRVPSSERDDSNNASAAASQAWVSIGNEISKTASENTSAHKHQIFTGSLYNNPSREILQRVTQFQGDFPLSGMQFQPVKNSFPFHAFGTPPIRMGSETHFQNGELNFPPSVVADLSMFQMQSAWQGLNPHRQPRQKQESLPPDLNIRVQSSGSPVGQSSGVLLDSQHPDLALQL